MSHERVQESSGDGWEVFGSEASPHTSEQHPLKEGDSVVKEVSLGVSDSEIMTILTWAADRETSIHLDPRPIDPDRIFEPSAVEEAVINLKSYYNDPSIIPFVAHDSEGNAVGVVSARIGNDLYFRNLEKFREVLIERLIVDPKRRKEGIGRDLAATAIHHMFEHYLGYEENGKNRGAKSIKAWSLNVGDWRVNYNFFRKLGFQNVGHWKEIAERGGHEYVDDANLFELKPMRFRQALHEHPEIKLCDTIRMQ